MKALALDKFVLRLEMATIPMEIDHAAQSRDATNISNASHVDAHRAQDGGGTKGNTMIKALCRTLPLLILAILAVTASGQESEDGEEKVFDADSGAATIDVSEYPEEMQPLYKLYAKRCSKCHTLARSVNSEYRGEEWDRYVARMSRKPNSGISPGTGEKILTFLKFHFEMMDSED